MFLDFAELIGIFNTTYLPNVTLHSDSKLTQLLQEQLGGNCHTRALVCLKPESNPDVVNAVVRFCGHLAQVKNFPVVNDALAQVSKERKSQRQAERHNAE